MRGSHRELRSWQLEFTDISESEASELMRFFDECRGRLKTFPFQDPSTGATIPHCRFASDELEVEMVGPEHCRTSFSVLEVRDT